jgi:hypothetical protein
MGNPITLDFSTAKPLAPANPNATTSTGVTLDFSTAKKLPEPTPSEQAFKPMPANQPSPAARGGYFLPAYTSPAEAKGGATQAALGLATAGATAGISSLASPSATATQAGTGVLDAAGQEIMREGIKYGPSAISQALAHPLGKLILTEALKGGSLAVGGATLWKVMKMLGIIGP